MNKTNEIKTFENEEFGKVRTILINGEPWFVGKDVADILGYSNSRKALIDHVDEDDKNTVTFRDGTSGNPNFIVINESGLYSLILGSKLSSAKRFKHWVTSEVLPALRKTGEFKTHNSNPCAYANAKDAIAKWKQTVAYPLANRLGKLLADNDTVSIYRYIYITMETDFAFDMNAAKADYCRKYDITDGRGSIIDVIADNKELRRQFIECACKRIKQLACDRVIDAECELCRVKEFSKQCDVSIENVHQAADEFEVSVTKILGQNERNCFNVALTI